MRSSTWRAAGNTYVVVEPETALRPTEARSLAGATDGVIEILAADETRVEIAIWNPDGSQAELSGNGTRIAAAWLAALTGALEANVVVRGRTVSTRALPNGEFEQDMGEVVVGEREHVEGIDFVPVSVGNPHAVVLGDPAEISRIGPLLERHPRFPQRTNVQVARMDGPGEVTARVWERGVGETLSSGTSAVAVAAATHGSGDVVVHFPGGDLRVGLAKGRAVLTGPVEKLRVPRQVLVYLYRRTKNGLEVLLLRRTQQLGGFWQGVTGAPDWEESDTEGALREVLEETGLDVSATLRSIAAVCVLRATEFEDPETWSRLYGPGVTSVPEEVYAAEVASDVTPVLAPFEHDAYCWCSPKEAHGLLRYQSNREALQAVVAFVEEQGSA